MSNDNETVENAERVKAGDGMPLPLKEVFGDLGKNWGWLMALGILFVVLGVIALGMPVAMTLTTVVFFAVLLFAGGVFQIIDAGVGQRLGPLRVHAVGEEQVGEHRPLFRREGSILLIEDLILLKMTGHFEYRHIH